MRALKGLEDIIDVYQLHFQMGPEGWYFSGEGGSLTEDPLHGYHTLRQLYRHVDPEFSGRVTVPVLWDTKTDTMVNNESAEIIRMFYTEFDDLLPEHLRETNQPGGGLYPEHLRSEIDALNDWVYNTVNNGVYKVGFANSQEAYDKNIGPLFDSLDRLEQILASTASDISLATTSPRQMCGCTRAWRASTPATSLSSCAISRPSATTTRTCTCGCEGCTGQAVSKA